MLIPPLIHVAARGLLYDDGVLTHDENSVVMPVF
jgi:hypothetical protein